MEENLFLQNWNEPTGNLLYESQWKTPQDEQACPVQIYQKAIQYQNRSLPFTFDLRFSTSQNTVVFYLLEQEHTFTLPQGDDEEWRAILRQYLNQSGFHQIFKPIKKIGKGNFASVYLAERITDKQKYAVKAFSKEAAYSEENGRECLIKEIDIMRHLNSPHNMKLCEVFESDNSLYIIFELLQGGQLFEKIKAKHKFKPQQVKRIVSSILEGLREMHAKNIMHRDLKPENILLRDEDTCDCVIADYGLAEFSEADEYLFVRCGTPGYVAPEVINIKDMKAKYSPICDIFSLGLIFHLVLFGKSLFKGKTYSEVLNENRTCLFSLEGEEYAAVDEVVMDLLKKMLKVNPDERITAEEAMNHPYFKDESEEESDLLELKDKCMIVGESPILTSANDQRKQVKNIQRDSCLELKMGKDNIITGKTQTVGSLGSGKISGFGAGLLKGLKVSKFVKPVDSKQHPL